MCEISPDKNQCGTKYLILNGTCTAPKIFNRLCPSSSKSRDKKLRFTLCLQMHLSQRSEYIGAIRPPFHLWPKSRILSCDDSDGVKNTRWASSDAEMRRRTQKMRTPATATTKQCARRKRRRFSIRFAYVQFSPSDRTLNRW